MKDIFWTKCYVQLLIKLYYEFKIQDVPPKIDLSFYSLYIGHRHIEQMTKLGK